jgi:hypothetical protein
MVEIMNKTQKTKTSVAVARPALPKVYSTGTFKERYADQNEKDHAPLERAVRSGKVKAVF